MKDRFSRLKFKIHGLKGPVLDKHPELIRHKAIGQAKSMPEIDGVLRYMIYLYDPATDLNTEYNSLEDRRHEAVSLSGLNGDTFKKILALEAPFVDIILTFLGEIYMNRELREWHTSQQELDYNTRLRWDKEEIKGMSVKQRSDLSDYCAHLIVTIKALEDQLFGDDEDLKQAVIVDRWSSPEKFAAPTLKLVNV